VAEQVLDAGPAVQLRGDDLGPECPLAAAEGAQVLGGGLALLGAGLQQPVHHLAEQVVVGRLVQLDLELAEAGDDPPPVQHLDLVVGQLGQPRPGRLAQLDRAAQGAHAHHRRQPAGAHERPHHGDRLGRGPAPIATEDVLGPDQQGAVLTLGQLDRPALAGAVAQARPPAGQA
jgi:hypothetical protein